MKRTEKLFHIGNTDFTIKFDHHKQILKYTSILIDRNSDLNVSIVRCYFSVVTIKHQLINSFTPRYLHKDTLS